MKKPKRPSKASKSNKAAKHHEPKKNREAKFKIIQNDSKPRPTEKASKKFDRKKFKEEFSRNTRNQPGNQQRRFSPGHTVTLKGEVQKNAKGFAFLLQKKKDIFIPPDLARNLLTGDTVEIEYNDRSQQITHIEIKQRSIKKFIGTYNANLGRRSVTLSDKTMQEEVMIKETPAIVGLRNGHKVLVEVTKYFPTLEGKIIRDFGANLAPKFDTFSVVVRSNWPEEFSKANLEFAQQIAEQVEQEQKSQNYKGRKDLRDKPFITIDGKDARDFDDAILVEKTSSGFVLYVAIADVAEFVKVGSVLDQEAYARATSVYFPEWVIPMLPEALSNGACSLRPNEEKLTLTCEIHYNQQGQKKSEKVYESVIRSQRRCIYEDVQKEFEAGNEFWRDIYELFLMLKIKRKKRGSLDLDLPEAKIILNEDSETIDIQKVDRVDAHKVIEEFMIAANEAVTELMQRQGWPFIFRIHEIPEEEAVQRFLSFAQTLGLNPRINDITDPRSVAHFLDSIKEHPLATTLYYLMLRSLKQARYDTENLFHFGLASKAYTHFTSPIRRYPDLIVHRLLKRYLKHEKLSQEQKEKLTDDLQKQCEHCSKLERRAESLDRQVEKIKKARFMQQYLGEVFTAKVTNITATGLFVELSKWFIEGLVPMSEIEGDFYEFIESKLMLKGKRTGKKYKLGDTVEVKVLRVDTESGMVDFSLDYATIQNRKTSNPSS